MVVHNGLAYNTESAGEVDTRVFNIIKEAAKIFEKTFQIKLTDDEICYITKMV